MTTDPAPPAGRPPRGAQPDKPPGATAALIVYILYFVGFAVPLTAVAGVILAYVERGAADDVRLSHLTFLINTFWIGMLAIVVAVALSIFLIGWAIGLVWLVWALVRLITGLIRLQDGRPVEAPGSWRFTA